MEYDIVDGSTVPTPGDNVRVRVLRNADGKLAVDRPNRDHPLEISADHDITFSDEPGTYEVRGEVNRVMLAERNGEDFLFLNNLHVEKVADELVELPREDDEPEWKETDATDTDVDVDVDSVLAEDTIVEESDSRSTVGEAESLTESLNELLLGKQ